MADSLDFLKVRKNVNRRKAFYLEAFDYLERIFKIKRASDIQFSFYVGEELVVVFKIAM